MSHATYQNKWTECMQELMEQVQIEYLPTESADQGQPYDPEHPARLYIKYLQIYKKLEDCHDQMVHPQKRRAIKKVLRSTIVRILELKEHLILNQVRPKSRFVNLNHLLTDNKLNPDTVEWRVPRYFLDDPDCKEDIEKNLRKIDHWLDFFNLSREPDPLLDMHDPFDVGLNTDQAVAIILKNERGRIGIHRAVVYFEFKTEPLRKEEKQRQKAEKGEHDDTWLQAKMVTRIAAHWRRKVVQRKYYQMKEEEFEFLGMAPPRNDNRKQIIDKMNAHRERRKKMQEDAGDVYEKALQEQLEWLHKKKGADIKADLLEERRQWILDYCFQAQEFPDKLGNDRFPKDVDEFYGRLDKDEPAEEADKGKDGKKGKDAKGKDAKGKDAKGKKGGKAVPEEEEEEVHQMGPTSTVQQFVEQINQYTNIWESKDERSNFEQRHDIEIARTSVFPIVEAELRAVVDDLMRDELANLKQLYNQSKKGGKGQKGAKKKGGKDKGGGGKKVKVKPWCSVDGSIADKDRQDCVPDLVDPHPSGSGVLKKVKPCHLEDFLGEYNYLGESPPPSAQMIKSLLVEHCILPLAQTEIRQKVPESLTARALLLYGPKGSGKSMLARAIATETGATFFDLSPAVIDGKGTEGKNGSDMLVYRTFICAQDMAPSVIYIDNVEQVFTTTGKKKKADSSKGPSRIKKVLVAAIKRVQRWKASTEQDRILFIGCTSRPFEENVAKDEMISAFDEHVWVSSPDYGSRYLLWQRFMEQHGVFVDPTKLNISFLAKVSADYPAGSIKQTVKRVLTDRRVQRLEHRPLKEEEFIGPLSRTFKDEDFAKFREFDAQATGEAAEQQKEEARRKAAEAAATKGKGK